MSTLVILDIDATLADAALRLQHAGPEPIRTKFNELKYQAWVARVNGSTEALLSDEAVPGMVDLTWALAQDPNISVMYLTARDEKLRDVTEGWLDNTGFPELELVMRPEGNKEDSALMKEKMIKLAKAHYGAATVLVVDDDPSGLLQGICKKHGWTFLRSCSGGTE